MQVRLKIKQALKKIKGGVGLVILAGMCNPMVTHLHFLQLKQLETFGLAPYKLMMMNLFIELKLPNIEHSLKIRVIIFGQYFE